MTETREQMVARHAAERAAMEARGREPDWGPAIDAYWAAAYPYAPQPPFGENRERTRLGLIAAFPLAPVAAPVAMDAREINSLARDVAMQAHEADASDPVLDATYRAIRATLARVPVARWPGDVHVVRLAQDCVRDHVSCRHEAVEDYGEAIAIEMARRLREHMIAGNDKPAVRIEATKPAESDKPNPIYLEMPDPEEDYFRWQRRWNALKSLDFHNTQFSDQDGDWALSDFIAYAGEACGFTMPDMTNNGEWIDWHGGECPVQVGALTQMKLRNGGIVHSRAANTRRWEHLPTAPEGDIIAYRIFGDKP